MATINNAAAAYLNTLKNLSGGATEDAGNVAGVTPAGGPSFGDLVKTSLETAIDSQHKSEQVSAKGLIGQADMTEVLQAVNDAELALNSVLAIRDRVIDAYEQILRTPI
jgi:flagellar hook-basal body complex protein FliE